MRNRSYLFCLALTLLCAGCGRKPRNIFTFDEDQRVTLHTLAYPSTKLLSASIQNQATQLEWLAIQQEQIPESNTLVGYNVYSLTSRGFIKKKPLNEVPIQATQYLNKLCNQAKTYMVKAIFSDGRGKVEGPASNSFRSK